MDNPAEGLTRMIGCLFVAASLIAVILTSVIWWLVTR